MANTVNLNAEVGANYIGDDSQPAIRIENSSTGAGVSVDKLVVTSTATVAQINVNGGVLAAAATIVPLNIATPSRASGAMIALQGNAFVSTVSLIFAAGSGWAGMGAIRVVKSDGTFGWIPVLPNAQVTAAAVE
jgi:hypothetical protein